MSFDRIWDCRSPLDSSLQDATDDIGYTQVLHLHSARRVDLSKTVRSALIQRGKVFSSAQPTVGFLKKFYHLKASVRGYPLVVLSS